MTGRVFNFILDAKKVLHSLIHSVHAEEADEAH